MFKSLIKTLQIKMSSQDLNVLYSLWIQAPKNVTEAYTIMESAGQISLADQVRLLAAILVVNRDLDSETDTARARRLAKQSIEHLFSFFKSQPATEVALYIQDLFSTSEEISYPTWKQQRLDHTARTTEATHGHFAVAAGLASLYQRRKGPIRCSRCHKFKAVNQPCKGCQRVKDLYFTRRRIKPIYQGNFIGRRIKPVFQGHFAEAA